MAYVITPIDAAEKKRGREQRRPRVKFTAVQDMLEVAHAEMRAETDPL